MRITVIREFEDSRTLDLQDATILGFQESRIRGFQDSIMLRVWDSRRQEFRIPGVKIPGSMMTTTTRVVRFRGSG